MLWAEEGRAQFEARLWNSQMRPLAIRHPSTGEVGRCSLPAASNANSSEAVLACPLLSLCVPTRGREKYDKFVSVRCWVSFRRRARGLILARDVSITNAWS